MNTNQNVITRQENYNTVQDKDGSKGGIFKGARHTEGGIDVVVGKTGKHVEVEDGEPLIIPEAVNNYDPCSFEGKTMTRREVVSIINQKGGGIPIKEDGGPVNVPAGSIVVTRNAILEDNGTYEFNGEYLTHKEILSKINEDGGGASFKDDAILMNTGGNINNKMAYSTSMIPSIVQRSAENLYAIASLDNFLKINILNSELKVMGVSSNLKYGSFTLNGKTYPFHLYIELPDQYIVDYHLTEYLGITDIGINKMECYFNAKDYGRIYLGKNVNSLEINIEDKNKLIISALRGDKEFLYDFAVKLFNSNEISNEDIIGTNKNIPIITVDKINAHIKK